MGRGEGAVVVDMELHRTEWMQTPCGQLIQVQIIGVAAHDGAMRNAVLNLKYHGQRSVAQRLALVIVDALHDLGLADQDRVITWAPTTSKRIRRRGFDQSELIARHVGAYLHMPVRKLLRRVSEQHQTGQTRAVRLRSMAFQGRPLKGQKVLIIDDVVTTASTMRVAAQELVRCGSADVVCIAPSRTA